MISRRIFLTSKFGLVILLTNSPCSHPLDPLKLQPTTISLSHSCFTKHLLLTEHILSTSGLCSNLPLPGWPPPTPSTPPQPAHASSSELSTWQLGARAVCCLLSIVCAIGPYFLHPVTLYVCWACPLHYKLPKPGGLCFSHSYIYRWDGSQPSSDHAFGVPWINLPCSMNSEIGVGCGY